MAANVKVSGWCFCLSAGVTGYDLGKNMNLIERLEEYTKIHDDTDICVYCGKPDCDKIALPESSYFDHPERKFWPGDMCHSECERE